MQLRFLAPVVLGGTLSLAPWLVDCVGDAPATPPTTDGGNTVDGPQADTSTTAVVGKVVDLAGAPVANAKVRWGSAPPVTTDSSGAFTLADAPATYDLDVATTDAQLRAYRGLHTRTPIVHVGGTANQAPLNYSYQGVATDGGSLSLAIAFVADESVQSAGVVTLSGTTTMNWFGSSKASGALATMLTTSTKSIVAKPAFASVALTAGSLHTQSFLYESAPESTITGNVIGTVDTVWVLLHDPQLPPMGWRYAAGTVNGSSFSVPTVSYAGVTYDVSFEFTHSNPKESVTTWLTGLPSNASGLTGQYIYTPVHATTPAEGATDVSTTTSFTWTATPGVYALSVSCGAAYRLTMAVATATTSLPDFSAMGVSLPTATSCGWSVTSYPTHTDLDDFVGAPPTRAKLAHSPNSAFSDVRFTTK